MNDSLAVDELNTPHHLREAAKKLFFSGLAAKRWGGGLRAGHKEKNFLWSSKKNKKKTKVANMLECEGFSVKATKKTLFVRLL